MSPSSVSGRLLQTDRQTDRDRETDRQTHRQTERQTCGLEADNARLSTMKLFSSHLSRPATH